MSRCAHNTRMTPSTGPFHFPCILVVAIAMMVLLPNQTVDGAQLLFGVSSATLLSGDIGACPDASLPTCVGGIASVSAVVRSYRSLGYDVFFVPYLDRQTAFTQMHPLVWGVNGLIFDYFGFPLYDAPPSLYQQVGDRIETLLKPETVAKPIATNVIIDPDSDWSEVRLRAYVHQGRYGFIWMQSQFEPNSLAGLGSAVSALNYLARNRNVKLRIVVLADERWDLLTFTIQLQQLLGSPSLFPHVVVKSSGLRNASIVNGTVIVGIDGYSANTVGFLNLTVDDATGQLVQQAAASSGAFSVSLSLPTELRDAPFLADQNFLRQEAVKASNNDPVVGNTSTAMPPGRNVAGTERYCQAGECPQGNLLTDGLRWSLNADIAFTSSGGLRGPGWPAGPVRISNLWGILPFANTACVVRLMGLKVFEILNYSSSLATYGVSLRTATGDRLLQVSGLRYTVNTELSPSKLIDVEVWDSVKGAFVPLERLQYYTVAADSFVCDGFAPFNTYLTPLYDGEGPKNRTDALLQNLVAEYLLEHPNYNTSYSGRILNQSRATTIMDWVQTPASCVGDSYWAASVATCLPCAPGYQPAFAGASTCTPKPQDHSTLIAAIVAPVSILFVAALLALTISSYISQSKTSETSPTPPLQGRSH